MKMTLNLEFRSISELQDWIAQEARLGEPLPPPASKPKRKRRTKAEMAAAKAAEAPAAEVESGNGSDPDPTISEDKLRHQNAEAFRQILGENMEAGIAALRERNLNRFSEGTLEQQAEMLEALRGVRA